MIMLIADFDILLFKCMRLESSPFAFSYAVAWLHKIKLLNLEH
jgi:hypothetical protein